VFERLGVAPALAAPLADLGRSSQQMVQIARALMSDAAILIMDEPIAEPSSGEAERLFAVARALKAGGTAILYVSRHLDEIFRIAAEVTVTGGVHSIDAMRCPAPAPSPTCPQPSTNAEEPSGRACAPPVRRNP
jgi:ABC-type sugar transport system ATPase subunit